jgi:hypothetical protein
MKKIIIALIIVGFSGLVSCKKGDIRGIGSDLGTTGSYLTMVEKIKLSIAPDKLLTDVASIKAGFKGSAIDSVRMYVILNSNTDSTTAALPCLRCQAYNATDSTTWIYVKTVKFPDNGEVTLTITATEIANALYGGDLTQIGADDVYRVLNMVITKDGRHFSSANTNIDFEGQSAYNMAMHWDVVIACPVVGLSEIKQYLSGSFMVTLDEWDDFNPSNPSNNTVNLFAADDPAVASLNLDPNTQFALLMYPSPTPNYPPGSTSLDRQYAIATIAADGLNITVHTAFNNTDPNASPIIKNYVGQYDYHDGTAPDPLGQSSVGTISSCNGKGKVALSNTFYGTGYASGSCCYAATLVQN